VSIISKKKTTLRLYPQWMPLAFLLPHLVVFCVFQMYPVLSGIYASFTDWDLGKKPEWIGFDNFYNLFVNQNSMYYWQLRWGLENTIKFVLFCVPFQILVPLFLAMLMSRKMYCSKLITDLLYFPSLLSLAVVMVSWNALFDARNGYINAYLGFDKLVWTVTEPYNWIAIVFITVWWCQGGNFIIYRSAIAGIPNEILEAASVDGANFFQRFLHITLPSIKFPLQYTLIGSICSQFGIWGQPDMFNQGGPVVEMVNGYPRQSNMMLLQYVTEHGFEAGQASNIGIASAMALCLGVLMFIVSIIQFKMMRRNYM